MTNIQPFIDGARGIDPAMLEGVKALTGAIMLITAADLLEGLTSWLTGARPFPPLPRSWCPSARP